MNITDNEVEQIEGAWGSHYWSGTAVGDIDGDGMADVVQLALAPGGGRMVLETITARKAEATGPYTIPHRRDVIVAVTDGLRNLTQAGAALSERISYGELSALADKSRYLRPASCAPSVSPSHTGCLTRGFVVDTHVPMGRQAVDSIRFDYEAARFDRQGRGFLGFDVVTSTDELLATSTKNSRALLERSNSSRMPSASTTMLGARSSPSAMSTFPDTWPGMTGYQACSCTSSGPPNRRPPRFNPIVSGAESGLRPAR